MSWLRIRTVVRRHFYVLWRSPNRYFDIVVWPLFDAGRLATAVDIADQQQQEAAANYAKTILVAFGEVENALTADALLQRRARARSAQVEALRAAVRAAEEQSRVGKTDQYGVLEQELSLNAAEAALLRVLV
jgi:outer membrane protein TolC